MLKVGVNVILLVLHLMMLQMLQINVFFPQVAQCVALFDALTASSTVFSRRDILALNQATELASGSNCLSLIKC